MFVLVMEVNASLSSTNVNSETEKTFMLVVEANVSLLLSNAHREPEDLYTSL